MKIAYWAAHTLISCLFFILLAGCTSSAQQDWHNYQRAMEPTVADHQAAVTALQSISGPKPPTPAQAAQLLRGTVLPRYTQIVKTLESLKPQTPEVVKCHTLYLGSMRDMKKAVEVLAEGIETNQLQKASEANALMESASRQLQLSKASQKELNDKYGFAP